MGLSAAQCAILAGTFPALLLAHLIERSWITRSPATSLRLGLVSYLCTLVAILLGFTMAVAHVDNGAPASVGIAIIVTAAGAVITLLLNAIDDLLHAHYDRDN